MVGDIDVWLHFVVHEVEERHYNMNCVECTARQPPATIEKPAHE
jgi:hypothetical protein